ncbi:MAG: PorV/PorQ family protein [Candidatus Kapaibacterium sp.]
MKITMKIATIITVFVISAGSVFAQAGAAAVPFLLISPDARSSGMGETGVAIADDINAIYWNPGGLGFLDEYQSYSDFNFDDDEYKPFRQVALSFSQWLPQFNADLFYSYGTYGQYFDEVNGTVAFNFIFMNLGEFTRTSSGGDVLGKFISNEFAVGLSWGTMIAPDLGAGVQLRYIQSNLTPTSVQQQDAGTGRSVSFDLGVLWKPTDLQFIGLDLQDRLALGLNLQNLGPKVTYINESDPLPTQFKLGMAYTLVRDEFNDLKIAADFAKLLVNRKIDPADSTRSISDPLPLSLVSGWETPGGEYSIGFEYWYEYIVALRGGYFTEPSAIGDRQFWTFGAGVRYDIFRLDFSYILTLEENHPLANTMRFSLLVENL